MKNKEKKAFKKTKAKNDKHTDKNSSTNFEKDFRNLPGKSREQIDELRRRVNGENNLSGKDEKPKTKLRVLSLDEAKEDIAEEKEGKRRKDNYRDENSKSYNKKYNTKDKRENKEHSESNEKYDKRERKPYSNDNDRYDKRERKHFSNDNDRYDKGERKHFSNDNDRYDKRERKHFSNDNDRYDKRERKPYSNDNDRYDKRERKHFSNDNDRYDKRERKPYSNDNDRYDKRERKPYSNDNDRYDKRERKPYSNDNDRYDKRERKPYSNDNDRYDKGERKPYSNDNDRYNKREEYSKDSGNERNSQQKFIKLPRDPRERKEYFDKKNKDKDSKYSDKKGESKYYGKELGRNKEYNRDKKSRYNKEDKPYYKNKAKHSENSDIIRLNKYIANAGICSRREADELILSGVVKVNGVVVTELGTKVSPNDKVQYGDQTLSGEKKKYLLLNKPKGYITTVDDPEGRNTVMMLIKNACSERIYPVGRLDRNTTGLLLFTNDGEIAKKLTHPKYRITKIYHVELDKSLKQADMIKITEGIELDGNTIQVDALEYVDKGTDKKKVGIELHSGQNRVVRRIFESLDYNVTKLDRVLFAGLTKKDLPRGHWRFLTDEEVNILRRIR